MLWVYLRGRTRRRHRQLQVGYCRQVVMCTAEHMRVRHLKYAIYFESSGSSECIKNRILKKLVRFYKLLLHWITNVEVEGEMKRCHWHWQNVLRFSEQGTCFRIAYLFIGNIHCLHWKQLDWWRHCVVCLCYCCLCLPGTAVPAATTDGNLFFFLG